MKIGRDTGKGTSNEIPFLPTVLNKQTGVAG
jgi:hypothetical protein